MKKIFTFFLSIFSLVAAAQYVGINTTSPRVNLHVVGAPANTAVADGIIAPRITRAQLIAKTGYGADQVGTVIYVSDLSGTTNAATTNVTAVGHYYFDGTTWNIWNLIKPQLYGFLASKNTANVASANTTTPITDFTEIYDSNGWFDPVSAKFNPKVPGYYRVNFDVQMYWGASRERFAFILKNGSYAFFGSHANSGVFSSAGSGIVYMDGIDDYIQVGHRSTAIQNAPSRHAQTNFQAFFVGER